ncbi:MAG: MraY family glycosyltransferase [Bacteroidales bacterium]|nr:MraY family glycosyltransferase [Bacteroidales bacterium]
MRFSKTLGIRGEGTVTARWSSTSKPALGGITFFIITLLSLIMVNFFIDNISFSNLKLLGVFMAMIVAFLTGFFDDAFDTKPLIKFLAQLLCGLILVLTGNYIKIFDSNLINYLLTVFWVVAIMNSVNMLDNMDAITTIVSIVIILFVMLLFVTVGRFNSFDFFIFICLLGSLFSFLFFNWHPSKMYMGDTGSQFLGFILAALAITYIWNGKDYYGVHTLPKQFFTVILVFSLPIIDTTTVFIKRISKGKSPFVGGRDHTTHHLSYIGLSDRQVAYVYAFIALISAALAYYIYFIQIFTTSYLICFSAYFVALFATLFFIALKPPKVQ